MEFKLPLEQFYHWEKETPYKTYLRQPHKGRWKSLMWIEVAKQVRSMASFLMVQDLPSGSNIDEKDKKRIKIKLIKIFSIK